MPAEKFVSENVARQRLKAAGFNSDFLLDPLQYLLIVKKRMRADHLMAVESAARALGPEAVSFFVRRGKYTSAMKQFRKTRFSKLGLQRSDSRNRIIFLLKAFSPNLSKLIKNQAINRAGYTITLIFSRDLPSEIALSIEKGSKSVGRLNFDLFFNKRLEPSAFLGNFQGKKNELVQEFKERTGQSPLDFFLNSFNRAFPKAGQLFAINPKKHFYRTKLNLSTLCVMMEARRKLTSEQADFFFDYLDGEIRKPTVDQQAVIDKVMAEKQRIITETTGMHKAALKRAGFKRTKSRTWRPRA